MAALARTTEKVVRLSSNLRAISTCISLQGRVKSPYQPGVDADKPTHTGQVWDESDFRNLRFVGKIKLVNPNFAIDLIAEDPIVVVDKRHIWSNSGGALGHPKVYINLDRNEVAVCGYSGRKFIQKKYYDEAKHGPSITYEEYLKQMEDKDF